MTTSLNPKRTVAELKELRALTGDANGAQEKIKTARLLCIVGYVLFGLNVLGGIAYGIMMAVAMS